MLRKRETAYTSFDRVAKIADKAERRLALRTLLIEQPALAKVVQYTYHPDVQFDVSGGELSPRLYKPSNHGDHGVFYTNIRKLVNFHPNSPGDRQKKDQMFADLASQLAADDVGLLLGIRDKKLPWKTLNQPFVTRAVPELFPPVDPRAPVTEDEE